MERPRINYFEPRPGSYDPRSPGRTPLRVVVLTSVRDTGDCDRNGSWVDTGNGRGYMEGAVERLVTETQSTGSLRDLISVTGVITDDRYQDLRRSQYTATPQPLLGRWIMPHGLLRDRVVNIPSDFRSLPLDAAEERRERKLAFERAVLGTTRELGGDIILSDHYMARIDYLHAELGMWGKVLNIHPAVTEAGHEFAFPGKTPTADAILRAQTDSNTRTGATLHFVDSVIDAGPIIAYTADTPVQADDKPEWLRFRSYKTSKLPLLVEGLRHYARNIYPNLDQIDLRDMHRREDLE